MPEPLFSSTGVQNVISLLQTIANTLGTINVTLGTVFPLATGTAGTASGGSLTLPASNVGYIQVYVPSLGQTVKVPYYT